MEVQRVCLTGGITSGWGARPMGSHTLPVHIIAFFSAAAVAALYYFQKPKMHGHCFCARYHLLNKPNDAASDIMHKSNAASFVLLSK
jgi:hypothetical protein